MNIDFGTAFHKPNGNAVKVTINEFREKKIHKQIQQWLTTNFKEKSHCGY